MALTEIVITRALTKIATDPKVIGRLLNCSDSTNAQCRNLHYGRTSFLEYS